MHNMRNYSVMQYLYIFIFNILRKSVKMPTTPLKNLNINIICLKNQINKYPKLENPPNMNVPRYEINVELCFEKALIIIKHRVTKHFYWCINRFN